MPNVSASVTTPDGTCPVTLHTPNGTGPWPGVVMYPDAGGVRPTFEEMADTLAGFGYAVLLPDVYYRDGDWEPFEMETVFGDPEQRKRLMTMVGSVTPDMIATDAAAFFDFLASRPPFYAWAAIVLAASSWTLGVVCLLRTLRWRNYGLKTLPQSAPDRR